MWGGTGKGPPDNCTRSSLFYVFLSSFFSSVKKAANDPQRALFEPRKTGWPCPQTAVRGTKIKLERKAFLGQ